jgi:hypothetical protein
MNSITKEVLLYIFHKVVIMPFQNYMVSRDIRIRMIGGPVGIRTRDSRISFFGS